MKLGVGIGLGSAARMLGAGSAAPTPLETFIATMEASPYWSLLYTFKVFIGDDRLIDLKAPGVHDLIIGANPPTYLPGVGFQFDGTNDQAADGLNASTGTLQNDHSAGYYSRTMKVATSNPMGAFSTNGTTLNGRTGASGTFSYRVNQTTVRSVAGASLDHLGLCSVDRNGTTIKAYRKGIIKDTFTQASAALPNFDYLLGSATGTTWSTCTIGAEFKGRSLGDAGHAFISDALETLFQGLDVMGVSASSPLLTASYSWHNFRIAVANATHTFMVGMWGEYGGQVIYRINNTTLQIDQSKLRYSGFIKDDHSAGALDLIGGKIAHAWCGHNEDQVIYFTISTDDSLENFGAPELITLAGGPEYPQIHSYLTDIWITHSLGTGALDKTWDLHKRGTPWVRKKRLLNAAGSLGAGTQDLYMNPGEPSASIMRGFCLPHPTNVQNALKVFQWDKSSGDVSDGTSVLGNVESGTNDTAICEYATLPAIRTPAALRSQRLTNVEVDGSKVAIVDFVTSNGSDAQYYVGLLSGDWWTGAHWTFKPVGPAGAAFWTTSHYFCGLVFAQEPHPGLRLRGWREDAGVYKYEQHDSADGSGDAWVVTLLKTVSGGRKAMRPISPKNAHANIPGLWQEADFYTDYLIHDIDTHWVI